MTKKDFILLAGVLSDVRRNTNTGKKNFSYLVERLSDALQSQNPRFDRDRFAEACKNK